MRELVGGPHRYSEAQPTHKGMPVCATALLQNEWDRLGSSMYRIIAVPSMRRGALQEQESLPLGASSLDSKTRETDRGRGERRTQGDEGLKHTILPVLLCF